MVIRALEVSISSAKVMIHMTLLAKPNILDGIILSIDFLYGIRGALIFGQVCLQLSPAPAPRICTSKHPQISYRYTPGHPNVHLTTLAEDPPPSQVSEDPLDAWTLQFLEEVLKPFEELIGPHSHSRAFVHVATQQNIETALFPQ